MLYSVLVWRYGGNSPKRILVEATSAEHAEGRVDSLDGVTRVAGSGAMRVDDYGLRFCYPKTPRYMLARCGEKATRGRTCPQPPGHNGGCGPWVYTV
jgi:hypothetical protein